MGEVLDEIDKNEKEKDTESTDKKEEGTNDATTANDDDDDDEKKQQDFDIDIQGKGIFDAFLKKFDNKQPEYAKELMYFSRTVKEYPSLTLKQAQDTYLKYGKGGGFKYISDDEEAKRADDA